MAKENYFKNIDIRKLIRHTTPKGELAYGFITKPSTEYDEKGQYFLKLKLKADDKETKKLIKTIDAAIEEAYNHVAEEMEGRELKKLKRATPSYQPEEDKDGNETGNIIFNFKRRAVKTDRNGKEVPIKLSLFDSMGQPVDSDAVDPWGGSVIKVSFRLVPFYTAGVGVGVSHRLEAIQLLKVVTGGDGQSAEEYGFKEEAGGFSVTTSDDEEIEVADNDGIVEAQDEDIEDEDEDEGDY